MEVLLSQQTQRYSILVHGYNAAVIHSAIPNLGNKLVDDAQWP